MGAEQLGVSTGGHPLRLQSSDPAQPCPKGPMGNGAMRVESWGGSWSRQPKVMCSTSSRIKVSKHAIFQCPGFPLPFGLVKGVGPIPKVIQAGSSLAWAGINVQRGQAPFSVFWGLPLKS